MADDTIKELWESLSNFVNDSLFSFFWLYDKRYNATVVTNKFRISFLFQGADEPSSHLILVSVKKCIDIGKLRELVDALTLPDYEVWVS